MVATEFDKYEFMTGRQDGKITFSAWRESGLLAAMCVYKPSEVQPDIAEETAFLVESTIRSVDFESKFIQYADQMLRFHGYGAVIRHNGANTEALAATGHVRNGRSWEKPIAPISLAQH